MTAFPSSHLLQVALTALAQASWQASVLAALVLILQWTLRNRISPRARHNLWLLVALRLMLPVVPQSRLSLHNLWPRTTPTPQAAASETPPPPASIIPPPSPAASHVADRAPAVAAPSHPPAIAAPAHTVPPIATLLTWQTALAMIWLAGATLLLLRLLVATGRLIRQTRTMDDVTDRDAQRLLADCAQQLGVRRCPHLATCPTAPITSPALLGLFHPRILIPKAVLRDLQPAELRLVLLHELAHHKRHDVAINWLLAILQALHWFNPIVWLVFARVRLERELACDELVLSAPAKSEHAAPPTLAYGRALLKLVEALSQQRPAPAGAVGILEVNTQLRRRITMIGRFTQRTWGWTVTASALAIALGCAALTDAVHGAQPSPAPQTRPANAATQTPAARPATAPAAPSPVGSSTVLNAADAEAQELDTRTRLQRLLPDLRLDNVGLADAIDLLRDTTALNISVNWLAIEQAGVDRNAPVSSRLRDVTAEQALRHLIQGFSGQIGYTLEGNVVVISSNDDLASRVSTRVYDVTDLLAMEPAPVQPPPPATAPSQSRLPRHPLVSLIESQVAPSTWRDTGGIVGTISLYGHKLVVTQTSGNHQAISALLKALPDKSHSGAKPSPAAPSGR